MPTTEVIGKAEDTRTVQVWMKASLETDQHDQPTSSEKYYTLAIDSPGNSLSRHWIWHH